MPPKQLHEFQSEAGESVTFEHIKPITADGARFDASAGNRRWRVDVLEDDVQVIAAWEDDTLAIVDDPEWLDEFAERVRQR